MGVSLRFGEAIDLIGELRAEWGTHLHASVEGWVRPSTMGDWAATLTAQKLINWFRNPGDTNAPFHMPPLSPDVEAATVDEVVAANELLLKYSAFAD